MKASESNLKDTRLVLLQTGTCSQTLFHILNQEFGNEMLIEERAAASLAGGVVYKGKVCGLAIGAILGAGVEAYHEGESIESSIQLSIAASQKLVASFKKHSTMLNCYDITHVNFNTKGSIFRYIVTGKGIKCFSLADKWAPKAIELVREEVFNSNPPSGIHCRSCATRVVREMGGSETESAIVAGFAGGIGLSGNICGALTASIWYKALKWLREHPEKKVYPDELAKQKFTNFLSLTDGEYLCPNLSGKRFKSIEEHSNFIAEGGCNKLVDILAEVTLKKEKVS